MAKRRGHGEGTVYYDDTRGRWVGQVWIDGRRRKVTAKTKLEAGSKLGRLIHGDENERHVDTRLTVAKLLDDWQHKALPNRSGRHGGPLSSSSMARYRWATGLLTAELGRIKATTLTADHVEEALSRLARGSQGDTLNKESLRNVKRTLAMALDWAIRRRQVSHNAAAIAEIPTVADDPEARRALSRDELTRLLSVLDQTDEHRLGVMFRCCAQLGLRPGEAAALCVDAIDFNAGTLAVIRGVQDSAGPTLVEELKTRHGRRTLTMPTTLAAALQRHIGENDIVDGMLWTGTNKRPLWPSTIRSELRRACKAANVVPAARPNELRHTFATLMADDGVPPHVLADFLGHTSTRMVDAVYRHRPDVRGVGHAGLEL